jgi:hypothetical protein
MRSTINPHQTRAQGPGYFYGTIRLALAEDPETILAYEMNGQPLPILHGAPLRLRVETQLGFTMVKSSAQSSSSKLQNHGRARRLAGGLSVFQPGGGSDYEFVGSPETKTGTDRGTEGDNYEHRCGVTGFICKLKDRKEVAEGTMAFRFENHQDGHSRPPYFDMTLLDLETDSKEMCAVFRSPAPLTKKP